MSSTTKQRSRMGTHYPRSFQFSGSQKSMRNFIFLVFLALLFPLPALAGGDAAEAYVTGVSGSQGSYQFAVRQTERTIHADGCTQYRVRIIPPQRTFWDKLNIGLAGSIPAILLLNKPKLPPHCCNAVPPNKSPCKSAISAAGWLPTRSKNACITVRAWRLRQSIR